MFEFSFNVNSCQAENLAARAVFIRQFRAQREPIPIELTIHHCCFNSERTSSSIACGSGDGPM